MRAQLTAAAAAALRGTQTTHWTEETLHTHKADDGKHKIDWTKGQVVAQ